ncbi:MAG: YigZ family protein [Stackebrandtia sp.]
MHTITRDGEHELVVDKSRFVCALARADDEAGVREFIARRRKRHWNATHNCTAYVLGADGETQRCSDDGEPSGTAGTPMLEVLKRRGVADVVAVVSRYFGGVKLGAGGLVRAYGSAVAQALDAVGLAERRLLQIVTVTIDYQTGGGLEAELRRGRGEVVDVRYGAGICLEVAVDDADDFASWVSGQTAGAATCEVTGTRIVVAPI